MVGAFQLVGGKVNEQCLVEGWEDGSLEGSMAGWDRGTGRPRVLCFPPLHKIKPMRNNRRAQGMDTTVGVKTHPDKLLARVDPGLRW